MICVVIRTSLKCAELPFILRSITRVVGE